MVRPPQLIGLVPKGSPSEKFEKKLMLEGEPSTLKFMYIATITPNEFKTMLTMHDMTQHHDQTSSAGKLCIFTDCCHPYSSKSGQRSKDRYSL